MDKIIKFLRILIKFPLSLIVLLLFFLTGCIVYILPAKNAVQKRKQLMIPSKWACCTLLKIMNVKVTVKNREIFDTQKNWYIMGNHMSYIDILMLLSNFPTLFITSNEMKATPILGQICFFGGSFFVERRKITTLKDEIPRLTETLKSGLNITLFPEGRCSDGCGLLPFKSALIESAVSSGVNVLPLCIMYKDISGRPVKAPDFTIIGYYNNLKFPVQFKKMLMEKGLQAEIELLPPIMTAGKDRKQIKEEIFQTLNSRYTEYLVDRL